MIAIIGPIVVTVNITPNINKITFCGFEKKVFVLFQLIFLLKEGLETNSIFFLG
jgi:hypothetical protein